MTDVQIGEFLVTFSGDYKAGDPEPEGYLNWHAWAEAQHKAGLRQTQCPKCCLWKYPQSLSTREVKWQTATRRRGGLAKEHSAFACLKCAEENHDRPVPRHA